MSMRKILLSIVLATGGLGAAVLPMSSQAESNASLSIRIAPPALRYEVIPGPRLGYLWVPGYWNWHHHRHVWVAGNWVRERRGYAYYPHRWEQRGDAWYLNRGRWDRDGDGIPDHRDHHPNNPYRR